MQSHQLAPMLTTVTTNFVSVDCAVTTARQFRPMLVSMSGIYDLPSPRRRGISLILKAYKHTKLIHPQLPSARSFLHPHQQLSFVGPSYHAYSFPLCGPTSIHYTSNFPLSVIFTISPTDFHAREF